VRKISGFSKPSKANEASFLANLIFDASLAYEMMTFGTEDQKEAARAFVEKRKPNYSRTLSWPPAIADRSFYFNDWLKGRLGR
jgi:hypothetical protein